MDHAPGPAANDQLPNSDNAEIAQPCRSSSATPALAPSFSVPKHRIVTIEHPCIVRNFARGFQSMGGEPQLKNILERRLGDNKVGSKNNTPLEPVVGVSLRPGDPLAKKLTSTGLDTNNVLIKVAVPRRTGRKRKRGTDEPFTHPTIESTASESPHPSAAEQKGTPTSITAPDLLRRLHDNPQTYQASAIGVARETHRFRHLPDFQVFSAGLDIMQHLRDHALPNDYNAIKDFRVDLRPGASHITDFPGPPVFTSLEIPHRYEYQQAAGIILVQDKSTGNVMPKNLGIPQRRVTWGLAPDVQEIPTGPPSDIRASNLFGDLLPQTISALEKIMETRPLITRRVALNALPDLGKNILNEAIQFVGYSFRAGPWRDCLIKYGVDPRSDPRYRIYQTLTFQAETPTNQDPSKPVPPQEQPRAEVRNNDQHQNPHHDTEPSSLTHLPTDTQDTSLPPPQRTSHIFDGQSITADGKTWQIVDIHDPLLTHILQTPHLLPTCDVYQWGWYHPMTISKARCIMRDKIRFLFAGHQPPAHEYDRLLKEIAPDDAEDPAQSVADFTEKKVFSKQQGFRVAAMASEIKAATRTPSTKAYWERQKRRAAGAGGEEGDEETSADAEMERAMQADTGDFDEEVQGQGEVDGGGSTNIDDGDEDHDDAAVRGFAEGEIEDEANGNEDDEDEENDDAEDDEINDLDHLDPGSADNQDLDDEIGDDDTAGSEDGEDGADANNSET